MCVCERERKWGEVGMGQIGVEWQLGRMGGREGGGGMEEERVAGCLRLVKLHGGICQQDFRGM